MAAGKTKARVITQATSPGRSKVVTIVRELTPPLPLALHIIHVIVIIHFYLPAVFYEKLSLFIAASAIFYMPPH